MNQKHKLIALTRTIILVLLIVYLGMSIYNAVQTDAAFDTVNSFAKGFLGRDALIDKGVVGHTWYYITHPTYNFNEISRSQEARVSYAALEGLGVWNLGNVEISDIPSLTLHVTDPENVYPDKTNTYFSTNGISVAVNNYIYHSTSLTKGTDTQTLENYEENIYSSLFQISFDTNFLVERGIKKGNTHKLIINMHYLNNNDDMRSTGDITIDVIVGQPTGTFVDVKELDCYILMEDIIGFDIEWVS